MKKLKVFKLVLLSVMALSIPVISVSANEARAINWSYANYRNIPGGGSCLYKLTPEYRNVKETTSKTASLSGSSTAALGGITTLTNNEGAVRSDNAALIGSVLHPASTATKDYGYYNRACTSGIEWSNSTDVSTKYSSDNID